MNEQHRDPADATDGATDSPLGFAAFAGTIDESWTDFDEVMAEIVAARRSAVSRPVPDLE